MNKLNCTAENSRKAMHFYALNVKLRSYLKKRLKDLKTDWESIELVDFLNSTDIDTTRQLKTYLPYSRFEEFHTPQICDVLGGGLRKRNSRPEPEVNRVTRDVTLCNKCCLTDNCNAELCYDRGEGTRDLMIFLCVLFKKCDAFIGL